MWRPAVLPAVSTVLMHLHIGCFDECATAQRACDRVWAGKTMAVVCVVARRVPMCRGRSGPARRPCALQCHVRGTGLRGCCLYGACACRLSVVTFLVVRRQPVRLAALLFRRRRPRLAQSAIDILRDGDRRWATARRHCRLPAKRIGDLRASHFAEEQVGGARGSDLRTVVQQQLGLGGAGFAGRKGSLDEPDSLGFPGRC